jgi:type II secretory pathway pseudopilin PulG
MKKIIVVLLIIIGALMVFQPVSTDNSNASNLNQVNELARTLKGRQRTEIFKDDAGTRRVLLGKGANDFYGLKVSPEGTDVYDASDDQLIFNSDQNVFKIVATDTVTVPDPGSGTSTSSSIEVDTGVAATTPLIANAYIVSSSSAYALPYIFPSFDAVGSYGGILWMYSASTRVSGGTVRFKVQCNNYDVVSGPGVKTVKYYLLQESAS